MATDNVVTFTVNINPTHGGSRGAVKSEIEAATLKLSNLIMNNVAFFMAEKQEKALTQNLQRTFATIVQKELARMGRQIKQFAVGIADKSILTSRGYTNIGGSLSITGVVSEAMQAFAGPVSLVSGTGPWPARSPKYLKERRKAGTGTKWFKQTGALGTYLANPNTYLNAYGPVSVKFTRDSHSPLNTSKVNVSTIRTGLPGRRTRKIGIGTVEVSALSRITSDMLGDPGQKQPSAWKTGLFNYLDPKMESKLLNTEDRYRPFLEHFLSYYLTRSIPNAVFRRIEETAYDMRKAQVAFNL